ncbi:MAG: hypothetical protein ACK5Q5_23360 [Planctomycetaceae bacterium]
MKSFILGLAAAVGMMFVGTVNQAEANHYCGGNRGGYGGGYGGFGGGYYGPSYGYGYYPRSYGYYSGYRPYNSFGYGYGRGYWGGSGISIGTPGFGLRYRW